MGGPAAWQRSRSGGRSAGPPAPAPAPAPLAQQPPPPSPVRMLTVAATPPSPARFLTVAATSPTRFSTPRNRAVIAARTLAPPAPAPAPAPEPAPAALRSAAAGKRRRDDVDADMDADASGKRGAETRQREDERAGTGARPAGAAAASAGSAAAAAAPVRKAGPTAVPPPRAPTPAAAALVRAAATPTAAAAPPARVAAALTPTAAPPARAAAAPTPTAAPPARAAAAPTPAAAPPARAAATPRTAAPALSSAPAPRATPAEPVGQTRSPEPTLTSAQARKALSPALTDLPTRPRQQAKGTAAPALAPPPPPRKTLDASATKAARATETAAPAPHPSRALPASKVAVQLPPVEEAAQQPAIVGRRLPPSASERTTLTTSTASAARTAPSAPAPAPAASSRAASAPSRAASTAKTPAPSVSSAGRVPTIVCVGILPDAGVVFVPDRAIKRWIRFRPGPVVSEPLSAYQPDRVATADDDADVADDLEIDAATRQRLFRKRVRSGLTVDAADAEDDVVDLESAARRRARLVDKASASGHDDAAAGGADAEDSLPFMGTVAPFEPAAAASAAPSSTVDGAGSSLDALFPRRASKRRHGGDGLDAAATTQEGRRDPAAGVDPDGAADEADPYRRLESDSESDDDDDAGASRSEADSEDDGLELEADDDPAEAYFRRGSRSRLSSGGRGGQGRGRGRGRARGRARRGGRDPDEDGGAAPSSPPAARRRGGGAAQPSERTMARLPPVADEALRAALATLPDPWKASRAALADLHASQYSQWRFELDQKFSLLFYGYGSKKALLMQFATHALTDAPVLVVNGYFPNVTIRTVLASITKDVLHDQSSFRSAHEHASWVARQFSGEPTGAGAAAAVKKLYLLVLSIDGPAMRNAKTQAALSVLAAAPGIHLLATADHINCALLWNSALNARFNWIWHDGTTFAPFVHETANETSLLGEAGRPTVRSVGQVLRSLTSNARGVFAILARHQLEQEQHRDDPLHDNDDGAGAAGAANNNGGGGGGDDGMRGLTFPAYYIKCLDAFLVSNDVALRSQLTEFRDHRIIETTRAPDGTDYLHIPLDAAALSTILEQME